MAHQRANWWGIRVDHFSIRSDTPAMSTENTGSVRFSPRVPYILPALLRWIEDNQCTPMLVASVEAPGVSVPEGYAKDGLITLNISERAVQGLTINSERLAFGARFAGRHFNVVLPMASLQALYAREDPASSAVSLAAMVAEVPKSKQQPSPAGSEGGARKRPNLRLVE